MSHIGYLRLELLSEATFGSDKMSHEDVDNEVVSDEYGIPYIPSRTIKGLLVEEARFYLELVNNSGIDQEVDWEAIHHGVYGRQGSLKSSIRVGNGVVEDQMKKQIEYSVKTKKGSVTNHMVVKNKDISWQDILEGFTAIRFQTAIESSTGIAKDHSLRSTRVILPGWVFYSPVSWLKEPSEWEEILVAMSALSVRRAGVQRNRGRGKIQIRCLDHAKQDITASLISRWEELVGVVK